MELLYPFQFIDNFMPDKIFFYVEPSNISSQKFILNRQESYHITKVLRRSIGDNIWLIDGLGNAYNGIIRNIQKDIVSGRILEVFPKYGENNIQIILGIGILKKDKLKFVVEKATECGVKEIIPLVLDKCVKRDINHIRLLKISKSAAKQCGRSIIPNISKPNILKELLSSYADIPILVCHDSGDKVISGLPKILDKQSKILLLVGPEGDFSKKEIHFLEDHEANFINLGNRRLRSETAVIVALSQINLYHD
ncbi:MAG: RsmE family RNA methyltransferase [Planctomycetia bacterium]|nr:RsmE family RNA methyltransferase [Planctomycetia bacterium]